MNDPDIAQAVQQAAADEEFLAELRRILDAAAAAAAEQAFACRACGRCCRFEEFGHKLYVTPGELALLQSVPITGEPAVGRCPHQVDGKCMARNERALGCRLFFCDPAAEQWFQGTYELFHERIKRLHRDRALPYAYVEMTFFLVDTRRRCP